MPEFTFAAEVTVSAMTVVEADTLADALRIAQTRGVVIGGLSSGADNTEDWIIDDADGEPVNIRQEL